MTRVKGAALFLTMVAAGAAIILRFEKSLDDAKVVRTAEKGVVGDNRWRGLR